MSRIKRLKKPKTDIGSGHQKQEKGNKEKIAALAIIALMALSVLGYMWSSSNEVLEYGEQKFVKKADVWYNKELGESFDFHPLEVDNLEIDKSIISNMVNSYLIYLTYDSENEYKEQIASTIYLLSEFFTQYKIYTTPGFLDETEYDIPVITCNNATINTPVLLFEKGNITEIKEIEDFCISFKSNNALDFLRFKDRLRYGLLGVIE